VKGTDGLDFAQVAEVIDVAKGAGWVRVGLLSK
jgi:biopolymer transport protein ExbD